MDPVDLYDAAPVRPGAAPTLDVVGAGLDTLAGTQPVWLALTNALLRLERHHFAAAARIEHPSLVGKVWTSDRERSPIQIASLAEFAPTSANKRPAVLVNRLDQEVDLAKRPIGNQFMGVRPGAYAHFMRGRHALYCVGGKEGEAEILAWEVFRDLTRWAQVIRKTLCLNYFEPLTVGQRIQLPEHAQTYAAPIACAYTYQENWRVFPTDEEAIEVIRLVAGIQ